MYRILIVDDESIIADGISDLLMEIKEYEIEIYAVYSGKKALEFMNRYRVDILISDICMPDINGLTLQKHVIQLWPFCKIIFLTGYDDFHYAQEAVRYNSLDYILKNEDDEQIKQSVKKAIRIVEEERRKQAALEETESQLEAYLPILRNEFMVQLLHGLIVDGSALETNLQELNIPLNAKLPVVLLLGRIENANIKDMSLLDIKVIMKIQYLVNKHLSGKANCISISVNKEQLVWFIQPEETYKKYRNENTDINDWERTVLFIFEILDVIQLQIKEQFYLTMSFIITEKQVEWETVSTEYNKVNYILNTNYRFARQIVLINDISVKGEHIDIIESDNNLVCSIEKKLELLELYLNSAQKNDYVNLVEEIAQTLYGNNKINVNTQVKSFFLLNSALLRIIYKYNIVNDISTKINFENLFNINKYNNYQEFKEYFVYLAKSIFIQKNNSNIQQGKIIISNVQRYIKNNLKEDLSLTLLADLFHFNSSYFSRLYKAETGQSLSEYIVEQRIDVAKLLLNENMKIHEVAQETGFHSTSYFINVFKRKTGVTPKQYCDRSK